MSEHVQGESIHRVPTQSGLVAVFKAYLPLWPFVLGLAFARSGLIVASYGSYTQTDEGVFTDGGMLIALAILGLYWLVATIRKTRYSKRQVSRLMNASTALEAAMLVGLTVMEVLAIQNNGVKLAFCAGCTLFGSLAIYYWLRRARGSTTTVTVVFAFGALFVSEIIIYACALLPHVVAYVVGALLVIAQYPCIAASRTRSRLLLAPPDTEARDYFGFAKSLVSNKQFLVVTAIGIALLSIVIGLLRGYPDGEPIAFTMTTRIAYMLLTMALSAAIIALVVRGKGQVMTVGIWIIMQSLACLALVAYAAFPESLDIGALFTTTLNAMMVGFTWYAVVAFVSYGWRDPYYYAIACWLVWLGSRAIARIVLLEAYPLTTNDLLTGMIMAALLLVSAQSVFVQFIYIAKRENEDEHDKITSRQSALVKLMGLDSNESLSGMRQATMQHNAEEMGKQFLLSDREVEVLALYALGFTQKRVAEELYISQGTAHAHIKRIYAKTGLHSRQEILDYMKQYTS
ncbi:helix-turn-helix transcriptional regulator [Raoultibacter timonensis]|uniref:HTH luxR-type domain-containing protein n=1 Tax=Raoultibacter timonensis TaxID=1907662 RepID=A0ABN6MI26_9ACTN|nr:LuxR C-terminal-related transcriptional regulator [Raoultibacter timonensis]BDE97660.1 hypothetical protein CE91St30_29930 [Raoultibacter timonensis]BDF52263.1 hypothetical protein CE91St31_29930 [Raoultibacter timonensis]